MRENTTTINCLAFQLSLARKKVLKWYEEYLSTIGLNVSYIYVMEIIMEFGPSTLSLIAEKLQQEKPTVSNLLSRMERDGYINRLQGKERRSMEVHLTDLGEKILTEALEGLRASDESLDQLLDGELEEIKKSIQLINNKI